MSINSYSKINDPKKAHFVNYINSFVFSEVIGGDYSLERTHFITRNDSITGQPQLIIAYEVFGTVGIYDLTLQKNSDQPNNNENKPQEPNIEETNNIQSVNTDDSNNLIITIVSLIMTTVGIIILIKRKSNY